MARITTTAGLRAIIGEPRPAVARKFQSGLSDQARAFLAVCPVAFIATVSAEGRPMLSPKGDEPGFIEAQPDGTLLIPERSGNRLVYTLENILASSRIAITAVLPGTGETLRIEGDAELDDDPALCAHFAARGRPALLVMRVSPVRVYFHCAKSLLRGAIWDPASWPVPMNISFGREIAANNGLDVSEVASFDAGVRERYRTDL